MPRLRGAALELGHDGIELDAAGSQQDEKMIEDIGAFGNDWICFALHGGDHEFDRLLAELLGDARGALLEERLGVGCRRVAGGAGADDRGEVIEGEGRQGFAPELTPPSSRIASPAAAMCRLASPIVKVPK